MMTEMTIEMPLDTSGQMMSTVRHGELQDTVREAGLLADVASQLRDAADEAALVAALRKNLSIWLAIRQDVMWPGRLPEDVRLGLLELADFCIATIHGADTHGLSTSQLQTLITIDLRVSAGLLEGQVRRLMGEEVFASWQSSGQPEGEALLHWLHAAGHA